MGRPEENYPALMNATGKTWLKRAGALGFLFFLVKGLLWLAVPGLVLLWGWLS